jgi:hypothetical protein
VARIEGKPNADVGIRNTDAYLQAFDKEWLARAFAGRSRFQARRQMAAEIFNACFVDNYPLGFASDFISGFSPRFPWTERNLGGA